MTPPSTTIIPMMKNSVIFWIWSIVGSNRRCNHNVIISNHHTQYNRCMIDGISLMTNAAYTTPLKLSMNQYTQNARQHTTHTKTSTSCSDSLSIDLFRAMWIHTKYATHCPLIR